MSQQHYVSRNGFLALRKQLKDLSDDLSASTRAMGLSAGIDNDLRENPEFLQLRTKVTYELPSKIATLQEVLCGCALIENIPDVQANRFEAVLPGAEVTVESENGNIRVFSILGFGEGDPARVIISYLSPVAAVLLDQPVGQEVSLPYQGEATPYVIIRIRRSDFLR